MQAAQIKPVKGETRILIAEDDDFLRKSVAKFIKKEGYTTLEAANGHEALQIFRKFRPDLILTDLRMPVMDGFDLLDEIIVESPETPVIIFSGVGDKPDIITAMRSGAWDYITKPIEDINFLLERIEKALIQAQMTYGYNHTMENALKRTNENLKRQLEDKQQLEKMIIHAKQEWERTVDALGEMIALLDQQSRLIRVNKAMARLLGKTPQEIAGRIHYLSSVGFDNREQAERDWQAVSEGTLQTGQFAGLDGKIYEVNITPYYHTDNTTVAGAVYIARDISAR